MNRIKKILCLHGSQQNAEIFRTRLGRIPHKARDFAKFVIIEAPNELPLQEGDSVPLRTWFLKDSNGDWDKSSVQKTIAVVNSAWESDGPFDGILGFSQGGTLATLIAGLKGGYFNGVRFVICIGAPDSPINYGKFEGFAVPQHVKSLHFAGLTDAVVSAQSSLNLSSRYFDIEDDVTNDLSKATLVDTTSAAGGDASIPVLDLNKQKVFITHPQGHCIPMKAAYLDIIVSFIQKSSYFGDKMLESTTSKSSSTASSILPGALAASSAPKEHRCISDDIASAQAEELEALQAIFGDDIEITTPAPSRKGDLCPVFRIKLMPGSDSGSMPKSWIGQLHLNFVFTSKYPDESPLITTSCGSLSMSEFTVTNTKALTSIVQTAVSENKGGGACCYEVIQAVLLWLTSGDLTSVSSTHFSIPDGSGPGAADSGAEDSISQSNLSEKSLWYNVDTEYIDSNDVYFENESRYIREATEAAYAMNARSKGVKEDKLSSDGANVDEDADNSGGEEDGSRELYSATARGLWKYTVGLVGKPSAGKSTFYNAVTRAALDRDGRRLADVAPHPFTTIEPNIGPGFFAGPADECDSSSPLTSSASGSSLAEKRSSLHGREPSSGRRLLPLTVKDVAGLVPGAYKGRGKGNKFLADLCDADVLVHVVDATGRSDRDGNILLEGEAGSSPIEDSEWIREELHRWIFGNIRCKWHSVLRKSRMNEKKKSASRLFDLFSGYKGPRHCAELAVTRAGLNLDDIEKWDSPDVHNVVAHYLSIRFPICLGLNKVDSFTDIKEGQAVVRDCVAKCLSRGEVAVPMSAKAESWLLLKQSHLTSSLPAESSKAWAANEAALRTMNEVWGGTGVLAAISAAVALKPPVYCYPVGELDTECPMGLTALSSAMHEGSSQTAAPLQGPNPTAPPTPPSSTSASSVASTTAANYCLRDCVMMKPGSTVGDLFEALKHGCLPNTVVQGEFVRCESRGLDRSSKKKQVGRDAFIDESNCVMKIQTNRKSFWQHLKK